LAPSRYNAEIDLEDVNDSHALAILDVTPGSLVLDIGAADGSVARRLVERGCRVVGVEVDRDAARAAEQHCERVVFGDVEALDLAAAVDGLQFDVALLLDVLEHLRDPLAVLRAAASQVKPGGRLIVSMPNVTHAALRLQLLAGRFEYTETGLLDQTHLHLFDRPAVERLLAQAGLTVLDRLRTTLGLTETEIPVDPDAFPPETVALALSGEDAETYQFVYVASPEPPVIRGSEPIVSLREALQRRAAEAERLRAEADTYVRTLEARVAELEHERERLASLEPESRQRVAWLEDELRQRIAEAERLYDGLQHVRMDLAIKDAQLTEIRAELAPIHARRDRLNNLVARHRTFERAGLAAERVPAVHRALRRIGERVADRL
jgi:2-polyprenyl-3-methyl-5-hydroxy-6-metoxy-1,4-benzoquinol methylase